MKLRDRIILYILTIHLIANLTFHYVNVDPECYSFNDNYTISSDEPFAYWHDKDVYVVPDASSREKSEDELVIVDCRTSSDPNMCVLDSYSINNLKEIKEILLILEEYEDRFPSDWERTVESMGWEWFIHNIAYRLGILPEHTADVDLNNADQGRLIPRIRNGGN